MGSQHLVSRKLALSTRFDITDDAGTPEFVVRGKIALTRKLSVCDPGGTEVAVISRQGLTRRYRILAGGQETTVSSRGFLGRRFEIDTPGGRMEAHGNFTRHEYAITRDGAPAATVNRMRKLRERFAVDVADGQDALLMLAVVLAIESIRDDRRRSAGS